MGRVTDKVNGTGEGGMADIVNLRRARKDKARAEKAAEAAGNRARFGRSKAERDKRVADEALAIRRLDGHRLGKDEPKSDP
jgi:Domain of unknown function (DUF4169)